MSLRVRVRDRIMAVVMPLTGLQLAVETFRMNLLSTHATQADLRSLNHFERKSFSQSGEDGILDEIFRRISITNHRFIEIGVGDGLENNTLHLLQSGWHGTWLEASHKRVASIRKTHAHWIRSGALKVIEAVVTPENIGVLLPGANAHEGPDLLSIDIDGNDYWVWERAMHLDARVVVIEYNAHYGPFSGWVMQYRDEGGSDRTTYYGASLAALDRLARLHGYHLVTCSLSGANAFFVKSELVDSQFMPVNAPVDVWQPLRLALVMPQGHKPEVGPGVEPQ